jgi:hypothetical protein
MITRIEAVWKIKARKKERPYWSHDLICPQPHKK